MKEKEHIDFLNAYYSKVYRFYDLTRKYYLFGRDNLLSKIATQQPQKVLEIGCGTGRNLGILKQKLPNTRFAAVEPCDVMRKYVESKYPWVIMNSELAENADLANLLGDRPDIIFISYTLSMVQEPEKVVESCLRSLSSKGKLYVIDFGDFRGLGHLGKKLLTKWLHTFHVYPEVLEPIFAKAEVAIDGPFSYWKMAIFSSITEED